ncbi:hypothetical protein PHLCEN_2v6864 [Hermanssonia centrifuga]|uniref:GST C-terminal domain-containing protein n=1 Tax=Hermanssonia centrifuga TaxID=98765 RepID=A0A2R6NY73_9APHY|nr:hypothetical protein PHLCEN_2v6864 [Hermanssonia centrifuga]
MSSSNVQSHQDRSNIAKLKREADGSMKRPPSTFRNTIEKDGEFPPEKAWATRTLIVRQLKGLEDIISLTVTSPRMDPDGWPFANVDDFPGAEIDPLYNSKHIKDLYLKVDPDFSGRFTVPILWDKQKSTIVNNESSEIIRIFNSAFNHLLAREKAEIDLYPEVHRAEIDELNKWVYDTVNDGVYKAGFAASQSAYEAAVVPLFDSLDRLEKILAGKDYLIGDRLTEADVRLFVTINNPTRVVPLGPVPSILPL